MINKKIYEPVDLGLVPPRPVGSRRGGISVADFAEPDEAWPDGLLEGPAMTPLRDVARAVLRAHEGDCPVVLAFGRGVIEAGLSRFVIDLLERGVVSAVATDGSGARCDVEIAFSGATGGDLAADIKKGKFGPVEETAGYMNDASVLGRHRGLGQAVGDLINEDVEDFPHGQQSILAAASRLDCTSTVHVAVGTDTTDLHPEFDAGRFATASFIDFRKLCAVAADMHQGVWLNFASAEVVADAFLTACGVSRSLGADLGGLSVARFGLSPGSGAEALSRVAASFQDFAGNCGIALPVLHRLILAESAHRGDGP